MSLDDMDMVSVWGVSVPRALVGVDAGAYLEGIPKDLPPIEWLWMRMDKVWDSLHLDNRKPLNGQNISQFYSHPVWLLNGLFSHLDETSQAQRQAIGRFIGQRNVSRVADYGGGLAELATVIAHAKPGVQVDVIEPYPSQYAKARVSDIDSVEFVSTLSDEYDVVVAQDVLEHVEDPIGLAFELAKHIHRDGRVVFANCFYPVIKCHLPSTFYLRHTFVLVMWAMGLRDLGAINGVPHARVFCLSSKGLNLPRARAAARLLRPVGFFLNGMQRLLGAVKRQMKARLSQHG